MSNMLTLQDFSEPLLCLCGMGLSKGWETPIEHFPIVLAPPPPSPFCSSGASLRTDNAQGTLGIVAVAVESPAGISAEPEDLSCV